jgi:hypothetical protein
MARFNPLPIFIGLVVFSVMIMPFVLDWNEPHLQRLLIGHDQTAKEIAHDQAVNQVMAGLMRSKVKAAFGPEIGGNIISDPDSDSGSALISEPAAPTASAMPASNASSDSGINGFSISADSPPQQAYAQPAGLSPQLAPAQNYMPNYSQPSPNTAPPQAAPTVGFSNQRFISQPSHGAYLGEGAGAAHSASGIDYRAPRHKVVVER